MVENLAPHDLASCGLPQAWAKQGAWTVLDTDFGDGHHFLNTWLAWQGDPLRPRMLHYVGIAPVAPILGRLCDGPENGKHPKGWQALAAQCTDLRPGFHRMILEGGSVSLTLCIGDVHALLGEQVFQADTVFATLAADKWAAHMLARRCKRGTRVTMPAAVHAGAAADTLWSALMQAAGFQWDGPSPTHTGFTGSFNPHWDIPSSRTPTRHVVQHPARCAIVGAGIAGASVAHALALRGWDVTVFDRAATPASGASGLPVGLAVPHVSADDNPRARLSRNGSLLLAQHADRMLVQGQDWDPCGVEERRPDGSTLWHPLACWIKPAQLVGAWLAHSGIRFVGDSTVSGLQHGNGLWQLHAPQGRDLGQFEVVVLANALGSTPLLDALPADTPLGSDLRDKLAALQAVYGTLSYGSYAQSVPGLPTTPVNGNGCFIPRIPSPTGDQWFAGSTFETDAVLATDLAAQHAANMARLRQLEPMEGVDLAATLERGSVAQWSATRCVTHDRLPLVGPVDTGSSTGLWLCVGMGSRGLSFSALCAELLAARLGGEPLPMEFSLSRSLDVNRVRRRPTKTDQA